MIAWLKTITPRTACMLADEKDYFMVIIWCMNKTTSEQLLLLSLSKTLVDLPIELECVMEVCARKSR